MKYHTILTLKYTGIEFLLKTNSVSRYFFRWKGVKGETFLSLKNRNELK